MQNYPRFAMPTGRFDPYFAGIWPGNLMLKPPEPAKTDGRTHSQTPSKEFLKRFGLSPEAHFSILSLLAYTGARLSSDSFGISETFDGFDHPFRYVFDIAGYRHYREHVLDLDEREAVFFRPEPSNQDDPNAVELVRQNGGRVGYVNRMQARTVLRWLQHGNIEAWVFRINGRSVYPRLFVMADIEPNC